MELPGVKEALKQTLLRIYYVFSLNLFTFLLKEICFQEVSNTTLNRKLVFIAINAR